MSGADITGIVVSVVATLISFGTLIYTIYRDIKLKAANKTDKEYKKKNDEEIRGLKIQLNDVIKNGFHEVSESISKLDKSKNQEDIFFETVTPDIYSELIRKEKEKILVQKGLYHQKITKVKKERTEQIRKDSVYKHTKK